MGIGIIVRRIRIDWIADKSFRTLDCLMHRTESKPGAPKLLDFAFHNTLTITGVIPYTVFFSDRPARDAGFAEMKQFLDGFSFDPKNPPNAAVMIEEGAEENDMVVVELTSPQYDETSHKLTYTAKRLDDYAFESEWPKDLLIRADKAIPETFGKVLIVIDDCPCLPSEECDSDWHGSCWHQYFCKLCGGCCGV
ncbi:MAG: hypothetical protein ACYDHX_11385 [Methanothrix sp.]